MQTKIDPSTLSWRVINDGVMGGLSRSRFECERGELRFSGNLSLENNGGFASILARLETPIQGFAALRMTVSGDGRQYQARLREHPDSRGYAWRALFQANRRESDVVLGAGDFAPVLRGNPVPGANPLRETPIEYLGFMLSQSEPGPFTLIVHEIALEAVRREA